MCANSTDPPPCAVCPKPATRFCPGCENIQYCSRSCLRGDKKVHEKLCSQLKMTIPCGTATDPPLCGVCPKPALLTCAGCENSMYCSQACQDSDSSMHKTLCSQFKDFKEEHRPSPNHRRVILFPQDEGAPRFIWLKYDSTPYCTTHVLDDEFYKYFAGRPEAIGFFDSHREIGRQYKNTLWMQHDTLSVHLPVNKSLSPFLGEYAARWRGNVICMAPTKYRLDAEWEEWDKKDREYIGDGMMVPYDLDTTSLGVHVACLLFKAKYEHTGRAYGIKAEGVGDGHDPK